MSNDAAARSFREETSSRRASQMPVDWSFWSKAGSASLGQLCALFAGLDVAPHRVASSFIWSGANAGCPWVLDSVGAKQRYACKLCEGLSWASNEQRQQFVRILTLALTSLCIELRPVESLSGENSLSWRKQPVTATIAVSEFVKWARGIEFEIPSQLAARFPEEPRAAVAPSKDVAIHERGAAQDDATATVEAVHGELKTVNSLLSKQAQESQNRESPLGRPLQPATHEPSKVSARSVDSEIEALADDDFWIHGEVGIVEMCAVNGVFLTGAKGEKHAPSRKTAKAKFTGRFENKGSAIRLRGSRFAEVAGLSLSSLKKPENATLVHRYR